ncbi:unnamed protein product [Coregonus sp. 'balchen']|nr:unnamed protein product [Coregonus sp. 'balchen']
MESVNEVSSMDQVFTMEYGNVTANQHTRDSSGSAQHSRRRVYRLVAVGFGLLCVLQVTLNVSLRLVANLTEGRDQLVCEKDVRKICPQDWLIKSGCSCYFISPDTKNWTESRQDCLDRGADLLIINSREEQALIKAFGHRAWIGLTDREAEGTWRWVDKTPLAASYWIETGEPNGGANENCVEIVVDYNDPVLVWNDLPCNYETRWICESLDSSGSAQHSRRRVYILVAVGFGLLCVLQVTLNVSLRLVANLTEGRDQLVCEKDVRKICPQDWLIKSGCSCYFISPDTKNWTESRQDCLDRGADLVIINSREEQALIKAFGHRAWIGLTDREAEGTWRWVDKTPLTASYWIETGEPNGGANENCVEIIGNYNDPVLAWNDLPCNYETRWICESSLDL